jgi:cell division protease FtsH
MNGDSSTCAQDNLVRVPALARRIVTELGMGRELGPVAFVSGQAAFLRSSGDELQRPEVSEATARLIDDNFWAIVTNIYELTKRVVAEHRVTLDSLATELIREEAWTAGP